jgi:hypothetical protein
MNVIPIRESPDKNLGLVSNGTGVEKKSKDVSLRST